MTVNGTAVAGAEEILAAAWGSGWHSLCVADKGIEQTNFKAAGCYSTAAELLDAAAEWTRLGKHVWWGAHPLAEYLEPPARGGTNDVADIVSLCADLDWKSSAHKDNDKLKSEAEVRDAVRKLGEIAPSVIIDTGHGLQAYWLLSTSVSPDVGEELTDRLHTLLDSLGLAPERKDLASVLRVPGSFNVKLDPVEVRIVSADLERRFLPEHLHKYLPALNGIGGHRSGGSGAWSSVVDWTATDPANREAFDLLVKIGGHSPIFHKATRNRQNYVTVARPGRGGGREGAAIGYVSPGIVKCFTPSWPPLEKDGVYNIDNLEALLDGEIPTTTRADDLLDEAVPGSKGLVPSPENPMAVARRHVNLHHKALGQTTLREWRGSWLGWCGTHWTEMEESAVRAAVYRDLEHAKYLLVDKKGGKEEVPWRPNRNKVANVLDALRAVTRLPGTVDAPSWLNGEDRPPADHIVACRNGLLDVHTRKLTDHTPDFFTLISVPFDYDPGAPPPTNWLGFLGQLWPDDKDKDQIEALQEWFAYVISGRLDLHRILLVVGPRRGGKGTIARIFTALVGKRNVAGPTLASLGTHFGLANLVGKPLAIITDARLGGADTNQVVEHLLSVSGEDSKDIPRKYRDDWSGKLPTRFTVMSNELPRFGDASGAIVTRFLLLQLTQSWLGKEDFALEGKLMAELPGILNWALAGLSRLIEQGRFTEPKSSLDALDALADLASPVSAFVRDRCDIGPGKEAAIHATFDAWKDWCMENGRDRCGTVQTFGRDLRAVVPGLRSVQPSDETGSRPRWYSGLRLKSSSSGTRWNA